MSDYHPNLDGPAEPYGLAIDANGSPKASPSCSEVRRDAIHKRLGELTGELVKFRRAKEWHNYACALRETDDLLDELDALNGNPRNARMNGKAVQS